MTDSAAQRRPVKHEHLGRERIDMVDLWVKRIECWCGWSADLEPAKEQDHDA